MLYNQPFDQPSVPNAGYVNGNPATGTPGSIPPAPAIEYPQREIVAVINYAYTHGLIDWSSVNCAAPTNSVLTQLLSAIEGMISYGTRSQPPPTASITAYESHGTFTFTVPAGVYWVYARVVGAGGGGAAGQVASTVYSGGGGAAGGTGEGWVAVTPGQTITVTVGQGGVGGTTWPTAGSDGGTSSFGSYITATGGKAGATGASSTGASGGLGGTASGGQINNSGGNGGDGNPYTGYIQGGCGGASSQGGGGRTSTIGMPGSTIVNGIAPGSGGGGTWAGGSSNMTGGTGADGAVILQYS